MKRVFYCYYLEHLEYEKEYAERWSEEKVKIAQMQRWFEKAVKP